MNCHISIIIPIYNVEKYLRQCLDSCLTQTMKEIEVICVDNGSTDGSPGILKDYAARDDRVIVFHHPEGRQGNARNAGLMHVRGKYTLFVDSDDWIHKETCQRTFELAEQHHADLCVYRLVRPWKKCKIVRDKPARCKNISRFFSDLTVAGKCSEKLFIQDVAACSKLIRTDLLRKHDITFPQGVVYEDMPFHWNIIRIARHILYITDELYYHRQRSGSTMGSRGKHHFNIIAIYDLIRQDLEASGCYDDCRQLFLNDKLAAFRRHYREISPQLRPEMRERILESLTVSDWEYIWNDSAMKERHRRFYMELKNGSFSLHNLCWIAFADFWQLCESHVLWPAKSLWEFDRSAQKTS
ncbi:MAG: glycosyltransferase [Planctomycetaceae bacterium]|nr:glycosyltransferase [Planctomycetaceae bacterium]